MYLVAYSEGFILNRTDNKLWVYEDIKKDLDISKKYDTNDIIKSLKYSRE